MSAKSKRGQAVIATSQSQKLDTRYQNILDKSVIGSYEKERFDFAIKEADRILKQYPIHGETIAMKGLCTHCIAVEREGAIREGKTVKHGGKIWSLSDCTALKKDGLALINEGLRHNVKSSIGWRVKGLVHKAEKDYNQAVRALKLALNYDPRNKTIMNDISQILTLIRHFPELSTTRKDLWNLDHSQTNAVAYLLATYLNNEFEICLQFLDNFLSDRANIANFDPVGLNEICLLKVKLLRKLDAREKCIDYLDEKLRLNEIKDELQAQIIKKDVLKEMGRKQEYCKVLELLVDMNPENSNFLREYVEVCKAGLNSDGTDGTDGTDGADENKQDGQEPALKLFESLKEKYPKSATVERLYLDVVRGKKFEKTIDAFLRKKFSKSVISVYNEIKSLYDDVEKAAVLSELIDTYVESLKNDRRFSPNDEKNSAAPSCLLWVNYFRASRLLDCNEFLGALEIVDRTLSWVPTCIDLYALKARIYKYGGDSGQAFELLNKAREMDTADRFLNTKCTRYALRAGLPERGEEMVRMFLKPVDGVKVLETLQVMWYELHKGECHALQRNEPGPGLREFEHVWTHFEKFWESQVDFQTYVYRKVSVSSYLALIGWEDELRNHPFFVRAAIGAVITYMYVYNLQASFEFDLENEKYLNAVRKGSRPDNALAGGIKRSVDALGWDLINELKNPLDDAMKWMKRLDNVEKFSCGDEEDTVAALAIKLRLLRKEFVDCANFIKKYLTNPNKEWSHFPKVFAQAVCAIKTMEGEQLDKEADDLLKTLKSEVFRKDMDEEVKQYFENSKSLKEMTSVLYLIGKGKASSVNINDVTKKMVGAPCNLVQFREAIKLLSEVAKDDGNIKDIESAFLEKYPLCVVKSDAPIYTL